MEAFVYALHTCAHCQGLRAPVYAAEGEGYADYICQHTTDLWLIKRTISPPGSSSCNVLAIDTPES